MFLFDILKSGVKFHLELRKNCYGDQTITFITELVAGYLLVLFMCELLVWGRGDLAEDEHKLHN